MRDQVEVFRRVERQYMKDRLCSADLQMPDALVIRLLRRTGQLRQEDIAQDIVLDKGTVARAVARLEERGLVERVVSPKSRREKLVSLTEPGEQVCREIETVMQEWNDICYRGFTSREREECDAFLARITDNVVQFRREEEHG